MDRSEAGVFPYQLAQASTPHRDAAAGMIQFVHPDAGEAQLEYDLRTFHDEHEAEAKAAGPLLAKSVAVEPLWWLALCNGLLLGFCGLTFWSVWVGCMGMFEQLEYYNMQWAAAAAALNVVSCVLVAAAVVSTVCIVCGTVHYFANFADCSVADGQDGLGWLASFRSTPSIFAATHRIAYLFLAEKKGWVTQVCRSPTI
jgi:hypothetical protein